MEETHGAFEAEVCYSMGEFSSVYVYNICKGVTKEKLVEEFKGLGEIKTVSIFNSDSRVASTFESSRYAIICFTTAEAGGAAIEANDGRTMNGHQITVRPHGGSDEHRRACLLCYGLKGKGAMQVLRSKEKGMRPRMQLLRGRFLVRRT